MNIHKYKRNVRGSQQARPIVFCSVLLIGLGVLAGCTPNDEGRGKGESLTVVTYGGAWGEAVRKAFIQPFEREYGVDIHEVSWAGDLGRLRAMVETGNVEWDVVDVEAFMVPLGARQDLLEPIDYSLTPREDLLPSAVREFGVATCFWSTVLAFNTEVGGAVPRSWADFWKVSEFPGGRSLRRDPAGNLELALLADGVAPDDLYPLDIGRAFDKLTAIREEIDVWWEAGEQPAQLLAAGEVAYATAWNGRVHAGMEEGRPLDFTWEQGLVSSDWWIIPKGTPNHDLAQEFVAFASGAEPQATFPELIPYGPVNKRALNLIPAEIRQTLPTGPENLGRQVMVDHDWWLENREDVLEQWNRWLLE